MKNKNIKKLNILLFMILISSCSSKVDTIVANESFIEETTLYIEEGANVKSLEETNISNELIIGRKSRMFQTLPVPKEKTIDIGETNFMTRINNIKNQIHLYEDKIINVEGMFATFSSWDDTFKGNVVYRNGPNDFDNDIWAGFFLDDLKGVDLKIDDWIIVSGNPYIYTTLDSEGTEYEYLFLKVINITKTDKRKQEFVND